MPLVEGRVPFLTENPQIHHPAAVEEKTSQRMSMHEILVRWTMQELVNSVEEHVVQPIAIPAKATNPFFHLIGRRCVEGLQRLCRPQGVRDHVTR